MADKLTTQRTGGAGARTQPLSDEDYKRQMDKLMALNRADSAAQEED